MVGHCSSNLRVLVEDCIPGGSGDRGQEVLFGVEWGGTWQLWVPADSIFTAAFQPFSLQPGVAAARRLVLPCSLVFCQDRWEKSGEKESHKIESVCN